MYLFDLFRKQSSGSGNVKQSGCILYSLAKYNNYTQFLLLSNKTAQDCVHPPGFDVGGREVWKIEGGGWSWEGQE